jgi:hypothetical protein
MIETAAAAAVVVPKNLRLEIDVLLICIGFKRNSEEFEAHEFTI